MSTLREGPNPLRPYYIPPSIGLPPETSNTSNYASTRTPIKYGASSTYASSARDIFSDIDYSDYVSDSSQSTLDTIKELLDQALYKYMSVLLAQPFEVAKTILQVRSQEVVDGTVPLVDVEDLREHPSYRDSTYSDASLPTIYIVSITC
jgi:fusion and transport protein UGO1